MKRFGARLTYANVMSTLAVFIALGGAAYAVNKINGKSIKKHTIAGNRLKADTLDGRAIDEAKLGEVPTAARATSAARADSAATADSATTATSATTADNAAALGGLTAPELKATSATGLAGICSTPTSATICGSKTVDLPAASDVFVIATGAWYGTNAGAPGESGECFITRDPATNSPSSDRVEMGQIDDTHDDFERGAPFTIHTTIEDVPAGSSTFRLRCDENNGEFQVEHAVVSVLRLSP
jgi:hypothetical protein